MVSILVVSFDKEPLSKSFSPFYKLTVNGSKKSVDACGSTALVAQYLRDTALFVGFGCRGQRAGFTLRGRIVDSTYNLDDKNYAWYEEYPMNYSTDSMHKGTLTIRTGYYQLSGGSIPYIEGEISFDAFDKNTGKTIKVANGKYLLRKYQY